jgi:hypothetical protein
MGRLRPLPHKEQTIRDRDKGNAIPVPMKQPTMETYGDVKLYA